MSRPDCDRRSERRLENDAADRVLCRNSDRNAGAERLTPQHHLSHRVTCGGEAIGGFAVGNQPWFAWASGQAAITTIFQCEEANAVGDKPAEALDAKTQRAAIAVKVQDHRLAIARRYMPGGDAQ